MVHSRGIGIGGRSAAALGVVLSAFLITAAEAQSPAAPSVSTISACAGSPVPAQREQACATILKGALPPKDAALTHYFRGFALRDLKQDDEALAEFSEAAKLDPDFWPAQWPRAELMMQRRYYEKAAAAWDQVIARNPSLASLYFRRGEAFDNEGHHAQAAGDFTKAIELARPKDAVALFYEDRAVSYESDRQFDKALADYGEAVNRDGHLARAYFGRGRVEYFRGDMGAAEADLARAVEADAADYYPLLWLFLAQSRGNGKDAAVELRHRASQLDLSKWPGPIIQVLLGDLAPERVKPPSQPPAWSDAERKAGGDCELSFYLGELRLAKGERARAVALFKTAIASGIREYIEYAAASYELDRAAH